VLHVFPDAAASLAVLDVQPNTPVDESLATARMTMALLNTEHTLILTDMFGATPCNIAQRLVDGVGSRLVAGVNLPMLLRAVSYRAEPLDAVVSRAVVGGTQGVMQVAIAAPQNQTRRNSHDQDPHDHQQ
jgi:PTS system ascorbate-specific IIA component